MKKNITLYLIVWIILAALVLFFLTSCVRSDGTPTLTGEVATETAAAEQFYAQLTAQAEEKE